MLTTIIHLVCAFIFIFGSIPVYVDWKKSLAGNNHVQVGLLLLFCVCNVGFNLALSLPYLIFGWDTGALAVGYDFAVVFLILMVMMLLRLGMALSLEKRAVTLSVQGFLIGCGVAAVWLQIIDFRPPVLFPSGFIMWNADIIAGALTGVVSFIVASAFAYELVKNRPADLSSEARRKVRRLATSLALFALAGILYFPARTQWQVVSAFFAYAFGTLVFVMTFLVKSKKKVEKGYVIVN
jgi:hypothetical protein